MRVNGDELRRLALPESHDGYLTSDVDEFLLRVAGEIDAGRPVGGLVANAVLRVPEPTLRQALKGLPGRRPRTYDAAAVHWFLERLGRCDDARERARLEADPWRGLTAWDISSRDADAGSSGTAAVSGAPQARVAALEFGDFGVPVVADRTYPDTWLACGALPGTRLRWVRRGELRRELRAEGEHVSASARLSLFDQRGLRGISEQARVVRVGGRPFTSQWLSRSAWTGIVATFGLGFPAAGDSGGSGRDSTARVLADQSGLPVLLAGGYNFNYLARAYVRLPGGRWLQFPVRGRSRENAIMCALDQNGDKVAVYRLVRAGGRLPPPPKVELVPRDDQVEIVVHPDQAITDELLLILAVSAPWLRSYFCYDSGGG